MRRQESWTLPTEILLDASRRYHRRPVREFARAEMSQLAASEKFMLPDLGLNAGKAWTLDSSLPRRKRSPTPLDIALTYKNICY